ncbi:MAG TPA: SLC13 family permease [Planctomycetota bacterium]|nr:SLC13 family permease [Planctomycetota bacterium]
MSDSASAAEPAAPPPSTIYYPQRKFMLISVVAAAIVFGIGRAVAMPVWLLATEVFATILGLFLFGSFKYQLHKNALTYGMLLIIVATFCGIPKTDFHLEISEHGWSGFLKHNILSFHGLDDLIHADTMLFILGLTFFVAVVAQTRILEQITFFLFRKNKGSVLGTTLAVTGVVAVASGILDGVSMIGLTIRTLVIIMFLAAAPTSAVRYAVIVCTAVTTICGVWLAYGEPPNLIMKANLHPHLTNLFFIRYCAPAAVASFAVVAWNLRKRLKGQRVDLSKLDVLDANVDTVRFMQAVRHGEVLTPVEFVGAHVKEVGDHLKPVLERIHKGEPMGEALVDEGIAPETRKMLLGKFVSEDLADALDDHYVKLSKGDLAGADKADNPVEEAIAKLRVRRLSASKVAALALIPFVGCLIWHGIDHRVPLFLASLAAFLVAMAGVRDLPKLRGLAIHEARVEFAEYYFLFPLFLSITLLTKAAFFEQLQHVVKAGIETTGPAVVALLQCYGCTFLSAILDNNVVADFASRALHNLPLSLIHLFSMAQITGYALGGCWTHIGCAQSVVAYAFIQRDVDAAYTPVQWIKDITGLILQTGAVLTVLILAEGWLLSKL